MKQATARDFTDLSYLTTDALRELVANTEADREEVATATYILGIRDKVTAELNAAEFTLGDIARKPTVAQEAIATADSHLNNAVLPTYSELLAALREADEVARVFHPEVRSVKAGALLGRHDRTMSGDFKG